jgi:hypothetical protein
LEETYGVCYDDEEKEAEKSEAEGFSVCEYNANEIN